MPTSPVHAKAKPLSSFEPVLGFAEIEDDGTMNIQEEQELDCDSLDGTSVHDGGSVGSKSPMHNKQQSISPSKRRGSAPMQRLESPIRTPRQVVHTKTDNSKIKSDSKKSDSKNSTKDKKETSMSAKDAERAKNVVAQLKRAMMGKESAEGTPSPEKATKKKVVRKKKSDDSLESASDVEPVDLSLGRSLTSVMGDISEFNKRMRQKLDKANGIIEVPQPRAKMDKTPRSKQKQLDNIAMNEAKLQKIKDEASAAARKEIMGTFGKRGLSMSGASLPSAGSQEREVAEPTDLALPAHVESKAGGHVSTKQILEDQLQSVDNMYHKTPQRRKIRKSDGMPHEDEDEKMARYRAMQRAANKRREQREREEKTKKDEEEIQRKKKEESERKAREGLDRARRRLSDRFSDRGSVVSYAMSDMASVRTNSVARYAADPATPEVEEHRRRTAMRLKERKLELARIEEEKRKEEADQEMAKLHEKQKAQKYHEEFRRKVADQLRQKKMKEREEKEHEEYQKALKEREKEEKAEEYERLRKEAARRAGQRAAAKRAADAADEREKLIDQQQELFEKAQKFKRTPIPKSLVRKVEEIHEKAQVPLPPPVPPSPKRSGPPRRDRRNVASPKSSQQIALEQKQLQKPPVPDVKSAHMKNSARVKLNSGRSSRPSSNRLSKLDKAARQKAHEKQRDELIKAENDRVEKVVVAQTNMWGFPAPDSDIEEDIPEEIYASATPERQLHPSHPDHPDQIAKRARERIHQAAVHHKQAEAVVEKIISGRRTVQSNHSNEHDDDRSAYHQQHQEQEQAQQSYRQPPQQQRQQLHRRHEQHAHKQYARDHDSQHQHSSDPVPEVREIKQFAPNSHGGGAQKANPQVQEVKQFNPSSNFQKLIQPVSPVAKPLYPPGLPQGNSNKGSKNSSRRDSRREDFTLPPAVPVSQPHSSRANQHSSRNQANYSYQKTSPDARPIPVYRPPNVHGDPPEKLQWNSYNNVSYGIRSDKSNSTMGSAPHTPVAQTSHGQKYAYSAKPPPPPPPRSRAGSRPGSARRGQVSARGYDPNASMMSMASSRMSVESSRPSSRRGRVHHDQLPPIHPPSKKHPSRPRASVRSDVPPDMPGDYRVLPSGKPPASMSKDRRVSLSPDATGVPHVRKDKNPIWRQSKLGVRSKEQILADKLASLQMANKLKVGK